jgi:hypothetical protein
LELGSLVSVDLGPLALGVPEWVPISLLGNSVGDCAAKLRRCAYTFMARIVRAFSILDIITMVIGEYAGDYGFLLPNPASMLPRVFQTMV